MDVSKLYSAIEQKNRIKLIDQEKQLIVGKLRSVNFNNFNKYDKAAMFPIIVELMTDEITKYRKRASNTQQGFKSNRSGFTADNTTEPPPQDVYDMHLVLQQELKEQSLVEKNANNIQLTTADENKLSSTNVEIAALLGLNNAFSIQQLFNPEATYIRNYLILDSRYRIINEPSSNNITQFTWNYVDNANIADGSVNSVGTIRNIVSMRVYQPRVPFVTSSHSSVNMSSETRRVAIVIQEFASQSFIGPERSRFHFMLQPVIPAVAVVNYPNMIELQVEEYNDGKFDFRKPITVVNSLTVSFLDPVNVIPFLHDRDTCTFTYGSPTIITTSIPHLFTAAAGLTYGVISGFTTDAPTTDAATIAAINSLIELTLTVTGASTFTVAINTSAITPTVGLVANIYFNERRVVLPMEFTYLKSDK